MAAGFTNPILDILDAKKKAADAARQRAAAAGRYSVDPRKEYYDSRIAAATNRPSTAADFAGVQASSYLGPTPPVDPRIEYYNSRIAAANQPQNPLDVYQAYLESKGTPKNAPNLANVVNNGSAGNVPTPVGGSSGGGGGGGYSGGGGSGGGSGGALPIQPSPADQLQTLLASLPQGPQGLDQVRAAYDAMKGAYEQANTRSNEMYDQSRSALQGTYDQTAQALQAADNPYVQALMQLNQQNENTGLGGLTTMQNIRGSYLNDIGASTSARAANAVEDITNLFNQARSSMEQQIIDQFMAEQMGLASSGGGSGGGGGGGRGGSGGGTGKTNVTETVYNPQNAAMIAEIAQTNPELAAILQRNYDESFSDTRRLSKSKDQSVAASTNAQARGLQGAAQWFVNAIAGNGNNRFIPAPSKSISNAKKSSKKYQSDADMYEQALQIARQFGGVQGNPKTTVTNKY